MPIIVCGSEGDWALFENTLDGLGADDKRRGSVRVNLGQQMFKSFAGGTDVWVHVRAAGPSNTSNGEIPETWLFVRDSSGTPLFAITETADTFTANRQSQLSRSLAPGGGLTTNAEIFSATPLVFNNYDIRIQLATTSISNDTITYSFYVDEVLRFSETIVAGSAWSTAGQLLLTARHENGGYDQMYYQDVVVTNALPTVGMELATLVPSAVGQYDGFINDYTNIDDLGYNQSTVISATAVAVNESWIFATPSFDLGDKVIYGVVTNTVAQTDVAGIVSDFQPFLRIGATDYDAASALGSNNIAPDSYVTEYLTNPTTVQPWTQAELSGLESGVRTL